MARIRSIHPGLWTDEAFVTLSADAALVYIGLLNEANDWGVFEWKPIQIKMRLRPASAETADDIEALLMEMEQTSPPMIRRFDDGGKKYGAVRNFAKWQRPKKPQGTPPSSEPVRLFLGLNADGTRPRAETGRPSTQPSSEPNPADGETGSELSPQRKEEGGKREEITAAQHIGTPREAESPPEPIAPVPDDDLSIPWAMRRGDDKVERLGRELRDAAGLDYDPTDLSVMVTLLENGWSLTKSIMPALREAKAKGKRGKSWRYYEKIITEGATADAAVPKAKTAAPGRLTVWINEENPRWPAAAERYRSEHEGKSPPRVAGLGGLGWHFPAEVPDGADAQGALASDRRQRPDIRAT